ncbi:hypothetical protein [Vallitalea okinawensis]|uniref:hypothetical protein n=1 Tax=Vallitalea okinawensis TaxID=2078660 RepID=UPI00147849A6|nr:hypothetical protein [Vallitalea okinawensis]
MLEVNSEILIKGNEVISLDECNDEEAFNIALKLGCQMLNTLQLKVKGIKTENEMKAVG